ncbi:hypothetical protein SGLAM104S_02738 [Streptomyces glaucescens]
MGVEPQPGQPPPKWSVGNGLTLRTATVTQDLYRARNTLTHRIQGPTSTATVQLDHAAMRDGDRAGLALLRDSSAWIGLKRDGGVTRVVMVSGPTMDTNWNTTHTGTELASAPVPGGRIWLRASADIRPGAPRPGTFSYSTDGTTFTRLGPAFSMGNDWRFFMGYRFALFNHATQALGGSVRRYTVRAVHALSRATDRIAQPPTPTRRAVNPLKRPGLRRASVLGPLAATVLVTPGTATGSPDAVRASAPGAQAALVRAALRSRHGRRQARRRPMHHRPGPRVRLGHSRERDEVGHDRAVPRLRSAPAPRTTTRSARSAAALPSRTPLHASESNPFARAGKVSFPAGAWTRDISRGETIRPAATRPSPSPPAGSVPLPGHEPRRGR